MVKPPFVIGLSPRNGAVFRACHDLAKCSYFALRYIYLELRYFLSDPVSKGIAHQSPEPINPKKSENSKLASDTKTTQNDKKHVTYNLI